MKLLDLFDEVCAARDLVKTTKEIVQDKILPLKVGKDAIKGTMYLRKIARKGFINVLFHKSNG